MDQPETPDAAPAPDPKPSHPLPDPGMAPQASPDERLPFKGKMEAPTAAPSATQRLANLERIQGRRKRKSFLIGLLVGQLVVIGLDIGGQALLNMFGGRVRIAAPIPVQALVFLGMAAGMVLTS